MFAQIMNFSFQRSALQAVGWYLSFSVLGILICGIAGMTLTDVIFHPSTAAETFQAGVKIGAKVSIIYTILVGAFLIKAKQKTFLSILLILFGIAISAFIGVIGGLITLSIVSTRPPSAASALE